MRPVLFLLTACAALVVFASPHNLHAARHHAIAARAPALVLAVDDAVPLKKRQSNKRCKPKPSPPKADTPPVDKPKQQDPKPTPTPTPTPTPSPADDADDKPDDKPPSTPKATSTSTPPPAATPPSNAPSFMTGVQTGEGTWFDAGMGACGQQNNGEAEHIVAVSWRLFDNYPGYNKVNPNTNPICNKKIRAHYKGKLPTDTEKTTIVSVTDRCADDSCQVGNLDFSKVAFEDLADLGVGRLEGVTWEWV